MSIFGKIFKSKKNKDKKRAMVYVDFEHWYISLDNLYKEKPDIKSFYDELNQQYDIIDISFFGDFSNPALRGELKNIRRFSNKVIETQNSSAVSEKDYTDFIMLDHIYQSVIGYGSDNIDAYVIFTGDGHFSSAVSFLVNKCHKDVIVYAVKNAASNALIECATSGRLVPDITDRRNKYETMILESLSDLYSKRKGKKIYPTFLGTVEAAARYNRESREELTEAMNRLIHAGYIYKRLETTSKGAEIKTIRVNWKAVHRDKLI